MFIWRRRFPVVVVVFVILLELFGAQQVRSALQLQSPVGPARPVRDPVLAPIDDESAVILPTGGKIDERPFFSSFRHPVIEYPDRDTNDIVAELARKVDAGTVRLRF